MITIFIMLQELGGYYLVQFFMQLLENLVYSICTLYAQSVCSSYLKYHHANCIESLGEYTLIINMIRPI